MRVSSGGLCCSYFARETSDPLDCYFGLWEGWGFPEPARRWPTFGADQLQRATWPGAQSLQGQAPADERSLVATKSAAEHAQQPSGPEARRAHPLGP
jgi:hypothetical protein